MSEISWRAAELTDADDLADLFQVIELAAATPRTWDRSPDLSLL
jgi:hypothetical protein